MANHAAHFLSRFDSIIVLDSGIVTHHGEYEELLAEGVINDSLPGGSESTAGDLDAPSAGPLDVANPEKADKEVENPRLSSEWNVYGYFLKSCGVAGMCVFFALAAAIAAGRSFESEYSFPSPEAQDGTNLCSRCLVEDVGRGLEQQHPDVLHLRLYRAQRGWRHPPLCPVPVSLLLQSLWFDAKTGSRSFFFDVLLSSSSLNLYFGQLNTLMR